MSTPCEITFFAKDKHHADTIAKTIMKEGVRLEKKYNYFEASSYLSQINQRKKDDLDTETKSLLQRAVQYYKVTNGIFDITVATIKDLYKNQKSLECLQQNLEALQPYVGCNHLHIKKNKISFDNEYTKIDLGGFVKEYAVDQSVKILKKNKITSALINFGGDIYALGKKPNGERYKIGIKNPHNPQEHSQFVEIEDEAITTSASYERFDTIENKTFSHIINTKNLNNKPLSATVISPSCVESGVYSTALMIDPDLSCKHNTIIL